MGTMLVLVLALTSSACFGGSDSDEIKEVVRAESFELVDQEGRVRAVWSVVDGTRPSLAMLDKQGDFRAWLLLSEDGSPNLVLKDNPRGVLMDGEGQIRSVNRLHGGSPVFTMHDGEGQIRWVVRLSGDGTPSLETYDAEGVLLDTSP